MDLYSQNPFWLLKNGLLSGYDSLAANQKTEVVIMGAGITGALMAWYLCKKGFNVIVVDKRHAGMGSTAASTALLQYEIDTPLHKLIDFVGEKHAVRSYQLCLQAIYDIQSICKELNIESHFKYKPSLHYASFEKHVKSLQAEYNVRKKHGIELDWLSKNDVRKIFGFSAPAALFSKMGGQVDPYLLTHAILQACRRKGVIMADTTEIELIEHQKKGIRLTTKQGNTISAKYLVIACGYESRKFIPKKIDELYSTYAIVSKPLTKEPWYQSSLLWETANPYLYLRTTADNRIIVGGKDDAFYSPSRRDAALPRKAKSLEDFGTELVPQCSVRKRFEWAGTFSRTPDGLPYIGSIRQLPRTFFALGYGGNGITFSAIAAQLICDALLIKNPDYPIFSFTRQSVA